MVILVAEGSATDAPQTPVPTPFEDDLFLGFRLGFNDLRDTQILAGWIADRHDSSGVYLLEAERRIRQGWKIEVEARWFLGTAGAPGLGALTRDDVYTVRVARHF